MKISQLPLFYFKYAIGPLKFTLILACLSIVQLSIAQHSCDTKATAASVSKLRSHQKIFMSKVPDKMERFVPIHFHFVARDNGNGRQDEMKIFSLLCKVNQTFEESGFVFYIDTMTYVNSTALYGGNEDEISSHKTSGNMNVFLMQGLSGGAAGYYHYGGDYIVLRSQIGSIDYDDGYTFEHEIGHFFSLLHAHHGWEPKGSSWSVNDNCPWDPEIHGDTVTLEWVNPTQFPTAPVQVELVDGSNCLEAGDGICDTPPDYGFMTYAGCDCCEMIYDVWDRNGDKIEPMTNNMMTYASGCNTREFTELQIAAMVTDYESAERRLLRENVSVESFEPIEDVTEIISPIEAEKVEIYDNVLLAWEPVKNADSYIIQIDKSGVTTEYFVNETELLQDDLKPNSTYVWSCLPYSKFGMCNPEKITSFFFTGEGSTSTLELDSKHYQIYPNPISQNNKLYISQPDVNSSQAIVRILSTEGKQIYNSTLRFDNGKAEIDGLWNILSSGIYYISIESEDTKTVTKLIAK